MVAEEMDGTIPQIGTELKSAGTKRLEVVQLIDQAFLSTIEPDPVLGSGNATLTCLQGIERIGSGTGDFRISADIALLPMV